MQIVKFIGGLGNQMFQHAFLIALREASNDVVKADISWYSVHNQHNGYELDRIFHINNPIANKKELYAFTCLFKNSFLNKAYTKLSFIRKTDIKERHSYKYYPNIISNKASGYYDGYWQSYLYFNNYKDIVIDAFQFKLPLSKKNEDAANRIKNDCCSVGIHVRRGDYLNTPLYEGLCTLSYYEDAIKYVLDQFGTAVSFFIFSNDITWCKENLKNSIDNIKCEFVDWNIGEDSYIDMQLMSLCKVNIIANSSFSWWAAYLNKRNDKLVIAPKKWVNLPLEFKMQLPDWHLL